MLEEEPEEIALFRQDQSRLSTATKLLRPLSLSLKASSLPGPQSLRSRPLTTQTACNQAPSLQRLMSHRRWGSEKASAVSDFRGGNAGPLVTGSAQLRDSVPTDQAKAKGS